MKRKWGLFLLLFLMGCSGMEKSEYEETRRKNCKGEWICRKSADKFCAQTSMQLSVRESYPWEEEWEVAQITKEQFRCKGSSFHASIYENGKNLLDCSGKHKLCSVHGKEGVFPILLDLLNYLQKKTKHRVVITCGYRCPQHNGYVDSSVEGQTSKHLLGAEVDFYVQGMENSPEKIVELILQFYKENVRYRGLKEYEQFFRFDKKTNVSTSPWYNKEIFIKLFKKGEGRDRDNLHSHPYLSIQVRYDRDLQEKVLSKSFEWNPGVLIQKKP